MKSKTCYNLYEVIFMFWTVLGYIFSTIILLSAIFFLATREEHQQEVDEDEKFMNELLKSKGVKSFKELEEKGESKRL